MAFHPNQWLRRKTAPGAKTNNNSEPNGRITLGYTNHLSICVENAELHYDMKNCFNLEWEYENRKMLEQHNFAYISLTRNSRNIVLCLCAAHTLCVKRSRKVARKQFQLRNIVMGRFTPAGRLVTLVCIACPNVSWRCSHKTGVR